MDNLITHFNSNKEPLNSMYQFNIKPELISFNQTLSSLSGIWFIMLLFNKFTKRIGLNENDEMMGWGDGRGEMGMG